MLLTKQYPFWVSLFLVSFSVLALNSANPSGLKNRLGTYLNSGSNIGGELTEIVSAPKQETPKENSFIQSALGVLVVNAGNSSGIYEDSEFDNPLITGEDSLLQNQNPITFPTVEPPKPTPRFAIYYGPSIDGYFIFPTSGFNQGRIHPYNAVDISRGDDCLYENIPVFAAASGLVTTAYPTQSTAKWANSGYGNNLVILHPNGVTSRYTHLKSILISAGQYVNQGSVIAFMGGYPRTPGAGNSTGCHLHFEVRGAKNPFAR
ncbi:MAG: M23 family metallopeptidase [Parcubacteria group bacterium]|nr:M23 family metallopeptidase [Parcubacteria group bacterium]